MTCRFSNRSLTFASLVAAAFALFAAPAVADTQPSPLVLEANIQAHPAMWTVHAKNSTAYLVGSIHLLPPNMLWRTPAIDTALIASDVFVFEAPTDSTGLKEIAEFVRAHGTLPEGQDLPSLLDPQALKDYQDALALTGLPPERLAHMRPWLAAIVLETSYMERQHYSPLSGVDRQVFAIASAHKKDVRYFETVDQQLSLLMPSDQKLEVQEFDADLRSFKAEMNSFGPLVDAWASGNARRVGELMNKDLKSDPGAFKVLIDDRNQAWMVKLGQMLDEQHVYFITVGAGHLVGPRGLPALLRAQGYRVDGP